MNRENLGWFVAGGLVVVVATMGAADINPLIGRYQIVSSRYVPDKETDPEQKERPVTILLNTITGEAMPLTHWPESITNDLRENLGMAGAFFLYNPFGWGSDIETFGERMQRVDKEIKDAEAKKKETANQKR